MARAVAVYASAPGKLFLLGEYAVLYGAPALVATVDVRARVRLRVAADSIWRVRAPHVGIEDVALEDDGSPHREMDDDGRRALAVFDAARRVAARAAALPPLHVEIDTAGFIADGAKLGLGASAAVAAALIGGFARIAGEAPSRETLAERAVQAHRLAQDGEGSGADAAAAVLGGVLGYRMDAPPRRLRLPPGLHALAVPSGRGANTRELVAAVRRLEQRAPETHRKCIENLAAEAEHGFEAAVNGDPTGFLAAANASFDALDALGTAAGTGLVSDCHRRMRRAVLRAGGVFKPTGAGGGDLAIVLADSRHRLDACGSALAELGHRPLAMQFGCAGLRVAAARTA